MTDPIPDLADPPCAGAVGTYTTCPRCGATSRDRCGDEQARDYQIHMQNVDRRKADGNGAGR